MLRFAHLDLVNFVQTAADCRVQLSSANRL